MRRARTWWGGLALGLAGCGSCGVGPAEVDAGAPVLPGRIEMAIVSGPLPGDALERAVKGVIPAIGGCLATGGRPPFRFTAEVRVEPSGGVRVQNVIWEEGHGQEGCIRDGLSAMRLAARPDATRATYTLRYDR